MSAEWLFATQQQRMQTATQVLTGFSEPEPTGEETYGATLGPQSLFKWGKNETEKFWNSEKK